MMKLKGSLLKMNTEFTTPISYELQIGGHKVPMNELLNRSISFYFENEIYCISCGNKTYKSFNQGYATLVFNHRH